MERKGIRRRFDGRDHQHPQGAGQAGTNYTFGKVLDNPN
jgi:hypothetical protein